MYMASVITPTGVLTRQEFRSIPKAYAFLREHGKHVRRKNVSACIMSKMSDTNYRFRDVRNMRVR